MALEKESDRSWQLNPPLGYVPMVAKGEAWILNRKLLERRELEKSMGNFLSRIERVSSAELSNELETMREEGLIQQLFPELVLTWDEYYGQNDKIDHPEENVWKHTLMVCSFLPANASLQFKLAAIFHDVNKPETMRVLDTKQGKRVSHAGHEASGAHTFQNTLGVRIRDLSRDSIRPEVLKSVVDIIERHGDMWNVMDRMQIDDVRLENLFKHPVIADLILLQFADALGCGLPKEKRLLSIRMSYIADKMKQMGLAESRQLTDVFSWIQSEVERIRGVNEDKLGYENWSPKLSE